MCPALLQGRAILLQRLIRQSRRFVLGMVPGAAQVGRQIVLGRDGDPCHTGRKPLEPDVQHGADGVGRATAEVLAHAIDGRLESSTQQRVGCLGHFLQLHTARPSPSHRASRFGRRDAHGASLSPLCAPEAQFELNCPTSSAEVVSRETIQPLVQTFHFQGTVRAEYSIGISGCGTAYDLCRDLPEERFKLFPTGSRVGILQ
ncbi:hypothetical protein QTI17_30325 [Variovorax sp. J31P179]|nr:hypothetical protein [Variovorax sp. J31P179]MDM0084900.1 hypothetical protein [Variovorax sp. J31P179]